MFTGICFKSVLTGKNHHPHFPTPLFTLKMAVFFYPDFFEPPKTSPTKMATPQPPQRPKRAPLGTIFREDCGEDVEVRPTEVREEIFGGDFSADQLVWGR